MNSEIAILVIAAALVESPLKKFIERPCDLNSLYLKPHDTGHRSQIGVVKLVRMAF